MHPPPLINVQLGLHESTPNGTSIGSSVSVGLVNIQTTLRAWQSAAPYMLCIAIRLNNADVLRSQILQERRHSNRCFVVGHMPLEEGVKIA